MKLSWSKWLYSKWVAEITVDEMAGDKMSVDGMSCHRTLWSVENENADLPHAVSSMRERKKKRWKEHNWEIVETTTNTFNQ
jgi:hypothetical protein